MPKPMMPVVAPLGAGRMPRPNFDPLVPELRFLTDPPGDGGGAAGDPAEPGDAGGDTGGDGAAGGQGGKPGDGDQDEKLGDSGLKALQAERKAHQQQKARADRLQKQLDQISNTAQSDGTKDGGDADDGAGSGSAANNGEPGPSVAQLQADLAAAQAAQARMQVALDNGIPSALAARLRGDTAEEMLADWTDNLQPLVASGRAGGPNKAGVHRYAGHPSTNETSGQALGLAEAERRFGSKET